MLTLKGQYNSAHIMIDEIDDTTRAQIQTLLDHPAFADTYIAIMPDCHAGKGAVIGFTMNLNDYIIPNIVGVDLGCGVLAARFEVDAVDLTAFDLFIKKNIPAGFSIHKKAKVKEDPTLRYWTKVIGMDYGKALRSIGTLGGGNHFIEVGKDSKNNTWVTIHSGSRNFGLRIANYFQSKAWKNLERNYSGKHYKDLEFLLVNSEDGQDYLNAARFAQSYAALNRATMLKEISRFFGADPREVIESVHNFIGDDNIIRKGATPARKGERVIIPFNMRDGLALCTGKGSAKYNYSAPHGAGRILSRTKAKQILSVDDFAKDMKKAGVFTTTATKETIDEAPDAYKDKELIIRNISETVAINDFVKPIYNFKAHGD
ncbi:MAG: RtcB family protein [Firmicutes bacterium]|nr:RtcB family protein [Bacillota bacterium]